MCHEYTRGAIVLGAVQTDRSGGDGIFASVSPCTGLEDILSTEQNGQLGNFTETPSSELLLDCSATSSAYFLHSGRIADVLSQPTPMLKV